MIEPAVFDMDECSTYLQIPKPTLYSLAQNGKIPAFKPSREWRFPKADLDAWLSKQVKRRMGR